MYTLNLGLFSPSHSLATKTVRIYRSFQNPLSLQFPRCPQRYAVICEEEPYGIHPSPASPFLLHSLPSRFIGVLLCHKRVHFFSQMRLGLVGLPHPPASKTSGSAFLHVFAIEIVLQSLVPVLNGLLCDFLHHVGVLVNILSDNMKCL